MSNKEANTKTEFWVVGIGASAGGLEALSTFFKALPEKPNAAFIVAQHLAPHAKSMMVELIGRQTGMKVVAVKDHIKLKPGLICIVPPNYDVTADKGELRLTKAGTETRPKPSVDTFFNSLAEIYGRRAVGIILSGTGHDGAEGIRSIKENGGMAFAQIPDDAKYDGMPKAAIETGLIDEVLDAKTLATSLLSLLDNRDQVKTKKLGKADGSALKKILLLLKKLNGADFSQYKVSTIQRRIEKRLSVLKLKDLSEYHDYLEENQSELALLTQNLLVSVTAFFRDTEAFEALEKLLTDLITSKHNGEDFRIWSAGCATGEEAYTLAFLVLRICEKQGKKLELKIFATDLDQEALSQARAGIYSEADVENVPQDYLMRFFTEKGSQYEVNKTVRELIVFARQDLIQNPPFVKLDLVSCRNVLIYFDSSLQSRVFQIFHYALKPSGILFLGKSESIDSDLFDVVDRKQKIFRRLNMVVATNPNRRSQHPSYHAVPFHSSEKRKLSQNLGLSDRAAPELLKLLGICGLVVDEDGGILQFIGDVSDFISFPAGSPDFRLQNLLTKDASFEFSILVRKVAKDQVKLTSRSLPFLGNNQKFFTFTVGPLIVPEQNKKLFLVAFQFKDAPAEINYELPQDAGDYPTKVLELEQEVAATKENLHTVIEELEISNEELQSLNEELSSTNEELQASNEELETTNEELQSTNEELMTLNEELNIKSTELKQAYASLENIQTSLSSPLLVLDEKLRLQRYNSMANHIFTLSASDIGQSIMKASCQCEIPGFERILRSTLETGKVQETLCETSKNIYQMRVHPNLDSEKSVVGVIVLFFDNTKFIQTQEKLKSSDKRIRAIIDSSPTLISLKDQDGRYLVANAAFAQFFGFSQDEILGKTDRELFPEEMALSVRDNDLEVLLKRNSFEKEEEYSVNGKNFTFLTNRFPLFGANDSSPYAVGTVALDVTDEVRAKEDLLQSEQRYRAIIEDQSVFTCRHDLDGKITFANTLFYGYFGGSPDQLGQRSFLSAVGQIDKKKVESEIEKINSVTPIVQYEHRVHSPGSGGERWIRWIHRGIFDERHELIEYQAVGFDVTDIHNQTADLLAKEKLYTDVLEHTSDYLSVYRREKSNFYLEMFNQSAANQRLIGHSQMVGKPLKELVGENSAGKLAEKFEQSLRSQELMTFEESTISPVGEIYLSTTIVPVVDEAQGITRVVAISRDITKLKKAEEALRAEMKTAEAANSAKSDFLASMSHELRTPLNVIMGMGQLLSRGELNPKQQKLIDSIQRSSRVLLALIEDVLDLSKIEAGKISFEMKPHDLNELVTETVSAFETEAQKKNLALLTKIEIPQKLFVLCDEVRFKQILNNLVGNAVKFTAKGFVEVETHLIHKTKDAVTFKFEVKDSGIGIPESQKDKIFKRFSQADSGISRKFGGTGLGLAISKQLVELMGGEIGFESQADVGSNFFFKLTFSLSAEQNNVNEIDQEQLSISDLKLMAVDDNPEALKLLTLMFEEKGVDIHTAESGDECLSMLRDNAYDLIFMDMQMPGLDGLATTKKIRDLKNFKKKIPVVALTANAMAGDRERCLKAGMNDYLTKPVHFNDLLRVIKRWV